MNATVENVDIDFMRVRSLQRRPRFEVNVARNNFVWDVYKRQVLGSDVDQGGVLYYNKSAGWVPLIECSLDASFGEPIRIRLSSDWLMVSDNNFVTHQKFVNMSYSQPLVSTTVQWSLNTKVEGTAKRLHQTILDHGLTARKPKFS